MKTDCHLPVHQSPPDYRAKRLEAFAEEDPHGYPRFGWRARYAVSEVRHWNDTCDIAAWNMGVRFAFLSPSTDHVPELHPAALHAKLRLRGVPLIVCDACEYPITSRHPRWPGVWVTPMTESGPLCTDPGPSVTKTPPHPYWYTHDDDHFGRPHRPRDQATTATVP